MTYARFQPTLARIGGRRAFTVLLANQRGQALVELGIVIVLLLTLVMGIIEFGYAWLEISMITHAARDGARAAAVVPADTSSRTNGMITNTSNITSLVTNEIKSVMDISTFAGYTASLGQLPAAGPVPPGTIATVTVTVGGTVPYIFNLPLVGSGFSVNRSVTFRDEGR